MKNVLFGLTASFGLLMAPASAGVITSVTVDTPAIVEDFEIELEYQDFLGLTSFFVFGSDLFGSASVGDVNSTPTSIIIDLSTDFLDGDLEDTSGGIIIEDDMLNELFAADTEEFNSFADTVEILFDVSTISGSLQSQFPNGALGVFTFLDTMGSDPLNVLNDGDISIVDFALFSIADPIPVPSAIPLMLTGLSGFWIARRQRRKASRLAA